MCTDTTPVPSEPLSMAYPFDGPSTVIPPVNVFGDELMFTGYGPTTYRLPVPWTVPSKVKPPTVTTPPSTIGL